MMDDLEIYVHTTAQANKKEFHMEVCLLQAEFSRCTQNSNHTLEANSCGLACCGPRMSTNALLPK